MTSTHSYHEMNFLKKSCYRLLNDNSVKKMEAHMHNIILPRAAIALAELYRECQDLIQQ